MTKCHPGLVVYKGNILDEDIAQHLAIQGHGSLERVSSFVKWGGLVTGRGAGHEKIDNQLCVAK